MSYHEKIVKEFCRYAFDRTTANKKQLLDLVVKTKDGTKNRTMKGCFILEWLSDSIKVLYLNGKEIIMKFGEFDVVMDEKDSVYQDFICNKYFGRSYEDMCNQMERIWTGGIISDLGKTRKILGSERLNSSKEHMAYLIEYNGVKIKACKSYQTCIALDFSVLDADEDGDEVSCNYLLSSAPTNTSRKHLCLFRYTTIN